ncbi:MAG: exodeoxyribonuclease VII small subunit [Clostridiales bacterium]|nr:exodeoxyribonuclease VII small subunit [Clostridiales bacterium]
MKTSEKNAAAEDLKFEDALSRLEDLSESLSREDVPLEDAIALYEDGLRYYQRCKTLLEDAERRVLVIEEGAETER